MDNYKKIIYLNFSSCTRGNQYCIGSGILSDLSRCVIGLLAGWSLWTVCFVILIRVLTGNLGGSDTVKRHVLTCDRIRPQSEMKSN